MAIEPAFQKYIIIVMGSSESGVTQFINILSELAPQTIPDPNPSNTLKPLDYGRITVDAGRIIYLYGLSEKNPDSAWSFLFNRKDPIGVIALVDSTRPHTFSITRSLIDKIDEKVPLLVGANKQDSQKAWELDAIRVALNLHEPIDVMGCSAKYAEGVNELLVTLVDQLAMANQATSSV